MTTLTASTRPHVSAHRALLLLAVVAAALVIAAVSVTVTLLVAPRSASPAPLNLTSLHSIDSGCQVAGPAQPC